MHKSLRLRLRRVKGFVCAIPTEQSAYGQAVFAATLAAVHCAVERSQQTAEWLADLSAAEHSECAANYSAVVLSNWSADGPAQQLAKRGADMSANAAAERQSVSTTVDATQQYAI